MRILTLVLAVLCTCVSVAQSEYKNILIDIPKGFGGYPPCEPSIAINPTNTNHLVAGAILDKVYVSEDGGENWTNEQLTSRYGVYGDPCLIANNKGEFFYLHLSDPSGRGWASDELLDRIVCQRSKDGHKWTKGGSIGLNGSKDQDKEWAAVHPSKRKIYTTWTQFDKYDSRQPEDSTLILFSKSKRKANKWTEPLRISQFAGDCTDGDQTVEGAVPAVGPDGEIYVAWALNESIYFDRSMDDGNTWLDKDVVAGKIVGGWDQSIPGINRCNGMPVTMVDLSGGERNGTIYINYTDFSNGDEDPDVWLIKSADKGNTWSMPVRVNDDTSGSDQFFTWMAIDQTNGNIYIVFYDRREYDDLRTDVYLATSIDGGETFTNERISDAPFIPKEGVFFGDYNNIAAHNGRVRPIWTRMDSGVTSVWTAIIEK